MHFSRLNERDFCAHQNVSCSNNAVHGIRRLRENKYRPGYNAEPVRGTPKLQTTRSHKNVDCDDKILKIPTGNIRIKGKKNRCEQKTSIRTDICFRH